MSSIAISLHEAALMCYNRSLMVATQFEDSSLVLCMDKSYTLAAAIVADYIAVNSNYPCSKHELEGTLRSLLPWWSNKPIQQCQAIIGEEVVLGGLKPGIIQQITYKETHIGRNELNRVRFSGIYYDEVIAYVEEILHGVLKKYIPCKTWVVWYQKCIGDVVIIEPGDDYRIIDWERRMSTGEWK